jgi:hypothetical protein
MTINELFDSMMIDGIIDNISGNIELHKKYLSYKYELDETDNDDSYYSSTYDDDEYCFDDYNSNEEELNEVYLTDKDIIELFLDENNELNNFEISDPNVKRKSISFKISSI